MSRNYLHPLRWIHLFLIILRNIKLFFPQYLFSPSHFFTCLFSQLKQRVCREEEDRAVAAAMRASMATRRQEERAAVAQERSAPRHSREERAAERAEAEDARHRAANNKPANKPPGPFFFF